MTARCLLVLFSVLLGTPCVGAQCHFHATGKTRAITYRFNPEFASDGLVMHAAMEFRASDTGVDRLVLPTEWAGEKLHAMTNLRVQSKGGTLEDGPDADTKILHAPANRPVVIAYDLKKDWTGPLVSPLQFHPVLMPEYFEFTGSNALVRVQLTDGAAETANFDWRKLPAAWALATSFGTSTSTAQRCQTHAGPWKEVDDGLYAGGDYRIHPFQIGRRPAVLAVRGAWTFTDEDAVAQIQKVVGLVRDFWHDDNFPYFLVTLKPYDQDHGSSDGSAFTNAFWMYISRLDSLSGLLPQLAHESFHAWNPGKMGPMSNDAYRETKWFKEGFTEYYAELLTYKAGELSISNYIDLLNKDLRRFPTSNDEYVRGRVIALWLDATIRRESRGQHSLDDVMFDMVRSGDRPQTQARIFETAGRYLSAESRGLLQDAASDHGNLPAPERAPFLGDCAGPSLEKLASYELGFDLERSQAAHVVAGVVEDGPAFAAGLRDGQMLHGVSVYNGDPDRMAKFRVHADDGDKQIAFYPRGKAVAVWQYRLDQSRPCERLP